MIENDDQQSQGPSLTARGPVNLLADLVAGIGVGVHVKLLSGYLVGALLVLVMAVLTLVVISSMNHQVEELTRLQNQVEGATKKANYITSQLHFRALSLLTNDEVYFSNIAETRREFSEKLALVEAESPPDKDEFFQRLREAKDRYVAAGDKVLAQAGNPDEAIRLHLADERTAALEVEQLLAELVAESNAQMSIAQIEFQSDRRLLSTLGWTFSGVSLATAVLIGIVMSSAFVRPVRRIGDALAQVAMGDFTQRVRVPNRDEFGTLSNNLNRTTETLGQLYTDLNSLNQNLQSRVDQQV